MDFNWQTVLGLFISGFISSLVTQYIVERRNRQW